MLVLFLAWVLKEQDQADTKGLATDNVSNWRFVSYKRSVAESKRKPHWSVWSLETYPTSVRPFEWPFLSARDPCWICEHASGAEKSKVNCHVIRQNCASFRGGPGSSWWSHAVWQVSESIQCQNEVFVRLDFWRVQSFHGVQAEQEADVFYEG